MAGRAVWAEAVLCAVFLGSQCTEAKSDIRDFIGARNFFRLLNEIRNVYERFNGTKMARATLTIITTPISGSNDLKQM